METKTYIADNMAEAMDQIKKELGGDAIIVKSRVVKQRTGFLKLRSKNVYEVVVSYDPPDEQPADKPAQGRQMNDLGALIEQKSQAMKNRSEIGRNAVQELMRDKSTASRQSVQDATLAAEQFARAVSSEDVKVNVISEADEALKWLAEEPTDSAPSWGGTPESKLSAYQFAQPAKQQEQKETAFTPASSSAATVTISPAAQAVQAAQSVQAARRAEKNSPPVGSYDWLAKAAANKMAQAAAENEAPAPAYEPELAPKQEERPAPSLVQTQPQQPMDASFRPPRKRGRPRKEQEEQEQQSPDEAYLNQRINAMETLLMSLSDDIRRLNEQPDRTVRQASPLLDEEDRLADADDEDIDELETEEEEPDEQTTLRHLLCRRDVEPEIAEKMTAAAARIAKAENISLDEAIAQELRRVLGRPRYLRSNNKSCRTVMFIGPTGVGKTTTLVKLAAHCVFERKAKIAMINADVFRVGAQDQLKAYANILDVPIKTIYHANEISDALAEFAYADFVFVDTCGKATMDEEYQKEVQQLIDYGGIQEVYVVVSSTTSSRVCRQIAQSYSFLKQYRSIVTKLDECGEYGGIVNLCYYNRQPLAYLTIGQNVPDDIKRADAGEIIKEILG